MHAISNFGRCLVRPAMTAMLAAGLALASAPLGAQTASPGCGSVALPSGVYQMADGALTRTFRVEVPDGYDGSAPLPVILVFHGWGGDENSILGDAVVTETASAEGYILVAPRGVGSEGGDDNYNSWTFRGSATGLDGGGGKICDDEATGDYHYASCGPLGTGVAQNSCSWTQCQTDDVAFVGKLIDEVGARFCADNDRIYAMGGSNGGMFSWELGQNPAIASRITAIAPLIGLPHRGHLDGPVVPDMPVMLITGKNDPTVPPGEWEDPSFTTTTDGDFFYYTGATAITRVWSKAANCSISEPAAAVDVGIEGVECRSYCGSEGLPNVMDCRVETTHEYELERTWPLIVRFFDAHR